ncbi:MAG: hypothetical protein QM401_00780 [Bacillota bacterium]|nr:hypothetical protein [Bacillota bacterium]
MIPYDKLDKDIEPLVRVLNSTGCLATTGSCIGHNVDPVAEVLFKVTDLRKWKKVMLRLLHLSQSIDYANIDVFQWHRLSAEGDYMVDWKLKLVIHPINHEFKYDSARLLELKKTIISQIIQELGVADPNPPPLS